MRDNIYVKGAREHNLKNIDVELPRNKLIVITGFPAQANPLLRLTRFTRKGNEDTLKVSALMPDSFWA